MNLGVMIELELEPHNQIQFSVILTTPLFGEGGYSSAREIVSIF